MAFRKPWKMCELLVAIFAALVFSSPVSSMAHDAVSRFGGFEPPVGTVWFVAAPDSVINNLGTKDSIALQEFIRKANYSREQIFPGIAQFGLPEIITKTLDDLTSSHPSDIKWFPNTSSGGFIRHFTLNGNNDVDGPWEEICKRTPGQNKWDSDSGHLLDESQFKAWKRRVSEYSGTISWEKIMAKHADDIAQSDMPWAHKVAFLLLDSSNSDLEKYIVQQNRGVFRKSKKRLEYWFVTYSVGPTKSDKIQISATSFRLRLEKNGVHREMYTFNAEL